MIADLERDIGVCVREYAGGRSEALADALAVVAGARAFQGLVGEIVGDQRRFGDVLERSVWHPNGFAKIVLLDAPEYRLRLHVWRRTAAIPVVVQENVHNHRWDFATAILAGGYRHQEFHAYGNPGEGEGEGGGGGGDGGDGFYGYRYESAKDRTAYTLSPFGRQRLTRVFDAYLSQGSRYTLSSVVLHKVVPDVTQPAVSLVLEGPHQPTTVEVFAAEEIGPGTATPHTRLTPESLMRQLSAVAALPAFAYSH